MSHITYITELDLTSTEELYCLEQHVKTLVDYDEGTPEFAGRFSQIKKECQDPKTVLTIEVDDASIKSLRNS